MRSAVKFIVAFICGLPPVGHTAAGVEWASHLAGTNFQDAGPVMLSPAGNIYFTGHAGPGTVFGTNGWTATSAISWFLAKHDPAGRLLWIQPSGRIDRDSLSTAFDVAENLYMTGIFYEHAQFGNFVLEGATNKNHIFLVKFEADGHVPWAKVIAWAGEENYPRLAIGPSGDVYVAVARAYLDEQDSTVELNRYDPAGNRLWQESGVIFWPQGANLHDLKVDSAGNAYVSGNLESVALDTADYYLAKFNAAGNRLWIFTTYGTDQDDYKSELAIDSQGFIYIAGEFLTQTQWGTNLLNQPEGVGVFLARLNPAGDVLWARNFRGTLNDFDLDAEGNLYLAGDFSGTLSLGTNSLTSRGSSDFFLARFDRDGTPLWIRQSGGTGWDHSPAVSLDRSGNVFLSGFFISSVDFGPAQLTSRGMTDLFIAKYNRQGKPLWAQQFGGSDYEYPGTDSEIADADWAVDATGNVYFSATFWGTTRVGANTFLSAGNTDVFFAKLAADPPETLRLLTSIIDRNTTPPLVQIGVTGTQGRAPIHIEASADLKTWSSIYTQAVPLQVFEILQPLTNAPHRFYRAVIP